MKTKNNKVPVKKINDVKKLAEKIKNSKTLMIVSIKGLPSKQFQDIKKSIRNEAFIQVAKKNILARAIKELKKDSVLELENYIKENCAFAISEIEGFELAGLLANKKTPVFAKAGQMAPMDIEVKEGPTDLVPGPAISELGALGIQISVENGKIAIKNPKVIVKQGNIISEGAASILQKLNVQPFSVGLDPIAVYDIKTEKIYTEIKINSEETTEQLKFAAAKALGFAQKIKYFCKETIVYFLAKADIGAKAIESKIQSSGGESA
jgi:large subunit ribosomal protein L10